MNINNLLFIFLSLLASKCEEGCKQYRATAPPAEKPILDTPLMNLIYSPSEDVWFTMRRSFSFSIRHNVKNRLVVLRSTDTLRLLSPSEQAPIGGGKYCRLLDQRFSSDSSKFISTIRFDLTRDEFVGGFNFTYRFLEKSINDQFIGTPNEISTELALIVTRGWPPEFNPRPMPYRSESNPTTQPTAPSTEPPCLKDFYYCITAPGGFKWTFFTQSCTESEASNAAKSQCINCSVSSGACN